MWRNGEAPPTAAESIAGAGQMAGSKSLAESDVKAYGSLHSGLAGAAMTSTNQLPYISAAEQQLNDPNFYSGAGEGINLAWKRVLSGLGIDPGAALPQEAFRKTMAANILQQVNNLRAEQEAMGVQGGRIFGTQIDLMEKAAQNPSNTLPANKYLTGIARWGAERARTIGDEADDYKIAHGQLDAAFEKQLRADLVNPEKYPAPPKLSDFEGKPSAQASPPLTTPPIPAPTPSPPSGMPPGTTMASSAAAPAGRNFLGTTPPPPSPAAPLPSAGGGADITRELGTANPIAQALMQGDNPIAGMTQEERKNHAMMHAGVLAGALPFTPGVAGKVAPLAWNTTKWLAKEGIHNLYLGEVLKALGH